MNRISESSNDSKHFLFFDDFEEEAFDAFVERVLDVLNAEENGRETGPYSILVKIRYEGHELVLTSGSFEGCFIVMDKVDSFLAERIIRIFSHAG